MADLIPWKELKDAQAAGVATGDFLVDAANAARSAWCSTFAQAPGALIRGGFNTPLNQAADGMFRRMCNDVNAPLPPYPTPPFSGGQCSFAYALSYQIVRQRDGLTVPGQTVVVGPVSPVFASSSGQAYNWFVVAKRVGGSGSPEPIVLASVGESEKKDWQFTMLAVVPQAAGNEDTCGNPPRAYPPAPLPDTYKDPPAITVPQPGGRPSVTIPVIFAPVNISGTVNISPKININVGGLNFNFSLGGVRIGFPSGGGGSVSIPGTDPGQDPNQPVDDPFPDGTTVDLSPVLNKLNQLDNKYDPLLDCGRCDDQWDYDTVAQSGHSSGQLFAPSGWEAYDAFVTLSPRPPNVKVQSGGADAPVVVFAGFLSWGRLNGWSDRVPLDRDSRWQPAPPGARAVCYTVYDGGAADVVLRVRKRKERA